MDDTLNQFSKQIAAAGEALERAIGEYFQAFAGKQLPAEVPVPQMLECGLLFVVCKRSRNFQEIVQSWAQYAGCDVPKMEIAYFQGFSLGWQARGHYRQPAPEVQSPLDDVDVATTRLVH